MFGPLSFTISVLHRVVLNSWRRGRRGQFMDWSVWWRWRSLLHRWQVLWGECMGRRMMRSFRWVVVIVCTTLIFYATLVFVSLVIESCVGIALEEG
jgi:hypothetical protein